MLLVRTPDIMPTAEVKVLLPLNGSNGSTTFTETTGNHSFSRFGTDTISTADYKFGGSSLAVNAGIYTPDYADFTVGAGDFTAAIWAKRSATGAWHTLFAQGNSGGGEYSFIFGLDDTNQLFVWFRDSGTTVHPSATAATFTDTSNWHHYALTRYGNSLIARVDGVTVLTVDVTGITILDSVNNFCVGSLAGVNAWAGYLNEAVWAKGVSLWTRDFTPPSRAM